MSTLLIEAAPVTNRLTPGKPAAQPASAAASARRRNAEASRTRILFAEDDLVLQKHLEGVLVRSGYDVDTANDGVEAWAALQERKYHLLITDNQMPRITGLELIRRISSARLTTPIILASGTVGALPVNDLPWLRCAAMLAKPFTGEQLLSIVHEVLRAGGGGSPVMEELHSYVQPHQAWGINE